MSYQLRREEVLDVAGLKAMLEDSPGKAAQAILAAEAGVFIEPGSAASIAGLLKAAEAGRIPEGSTIVCTVTGNGLKDTATALGGRELDINPIAPTLEAAAAALGL